ncbi:hypothetical protein SC09_contig4orf00085 [Bacillus subtilis]|uniref:Uncharacterized protein n=1 Tax=Bacillus subtilis TaxID=1423 RepID=A0A0D1KAQ9_BACIU|nr:hypothetical protein SC09_contig4orf00085 [Bacillus subtilis]
MLKNVKGPLLFLYNLSTIESSILARDMTEKRTAQSKQCVFL